MPHTDQVPADLPWISHQSRNVRLNVYISLMISGISFYTIPDVYFYQKATYHMDHPWLRYHR